MRIIKKILVWISVIIALLVAFALGFSYLYAEKVETLVLSRINEVLERPTTFKEINFSFFKKFPKASIELEQVAVEGLTKRDPLFIEAEQIFLSFDVLSAFEDAIEIKELHIENAVVNVSIDKSGHGNYNIFKASQDTSSKELALEKVHLLNTKVSYKDESNNFSTKIHSYRSSISGSIGDEIALNADFDGSVDHLNGAKYSVSHIPVRGQLGFSKDNSGILFFGKKLMLASLNSEIKGSIKKDAGEIEISCDVSRGDVGDLVKVLGEEQMKSLAPYQLAGQVQLKGAYKRDNKRRSSIEVDFGFLDAKAKLAKKYTVEDWDATGKLTIPNLSYLKRGKVQVQKLNLRTGNSELLISGKVNDLKALHADLALKGSLNLAELFDKMDSTSVIVEKGSILFNTNFKGTLSAFSNYKNNGAFKTIESKGDIQIESLQFKNKEESTTFKDFNGSLEFDQNHLILDQMAGEINGTRVKLNAILADYVPFIYDETDLYMKGKLVADKVKLEDFMSSKEKSQKKDNLTFTLPKNFDASLDVELADLSFKAFKANNIKGNIKLKDQILWINKINFNSCGGSARGTGKIKAYDFKDITYSGEIILSGVDIKQAFSQLDNFGQDFIRDKHLSGKIDSKMKFYMASSPTLEMLLDRLVVEAQVSVAQGRIQDLSSLVELEQFLKDEFKIDLPMKDVHFEQIKNTIKIADEIITIPEMKVLSSTINLDFEGSHSFDQKIDYLIKVKHSEIFKAKNKNEIDAKYGVIEHDDKTSTLPLRMYGTVDEPKFSYYLKTKKQIFKDNWKKEGQEVKEAIKDEIKDIFGPKKTEEEKQKEKQKEKEEKTRIEVIWDEED